MYDMYITGCRPNVGTRLWLPRGNVLDAASKSKQNTIYRLVYAAPTPAVMILIICTLVALGALLGASGELFDST